MTRRSSLFAVAVLASLTALLAGCGSDTDKIKFKVQTEIDACKAADGELYEVKFTTDSYKMFRSFCEEPPSEPVFRDELNAHIAVGPYKFVLAKDVSTTRWTLTRVSWESYDSVEDFFALDEINPSDYPTVDELLVKVIKDAPKMESSYTRRLDIALRQRRKVAKKKDPSPEGLGKAAPIFKQSIDAAKAQSNANLEAKLRAQVIEYYNKYRLFAQDNSTVGENASDWEKGAIKAVEIEAKEAKAKGKDDLYKKKMAEIDERTKEMEANIAKRQASAEWMSKFTAKLQKRQCEEIAAAKTLAPSDKTARGALDAALSSYECK